MIEPLLNPGEEAPRTQAGPVWHHEAEGNGCRVTAITPVGEPLYIRHIRTMRTVGVALIDAHGNYIAHSVRDRTTL